MLSDTNPFTFLYNNQNKYGWQLYHAGEESLRVRQSAKKSSKGIRGVANLSLILTTDDEPY